MKKLLLFITVATLVNVSHITYGMKKGIEKVRKNTFFKTINAGNTAKAEKLLNKNPDLINIKNQDDSTPLHLAIKKNNPKMVELLLTYEADPNIIDEEGYTPLYKAIEDRDINMVTLLLKYKADTNIQDKNGRTPLHLSVEIHDLDIAKLLLKHKADPNVQNFNDYTPLHLATKDKNQPMATLLLKYQADTNIQDYTGRTPLAWAIYGQDQEMATLLLNNGADANIPNNNGTTPLHWATILNLEKMITLLLEHKADINKPDAKGYTPLYWAIDKKKINMIKLLLNENANPNIANTENGYSPLHLAVEIHLAAEKAYPEKLKEISFWISLNLHNQERMAPFLDLIADQEMTPQKITAFLLDHEDNQKMIASLLDLIADQEMTQETIALLLDHNANINIQDNKGLTPLNLAVDSLAINPNNQKIIELLLGHTTSQEIEKLALPFLMALKRKRKESKTFPRMPKDMRNLLVQYIIIEDKLKKAKELLPDYDENKLRAIIEKGVIRAIRNKKTTTSDPYN